MIGSNNNVAGQYVRIFKTSHQQAGNAVTGCRAFRTINQGANFGRGVGE